MMWRRYGTHLALLCALLWSGCAHPPRGALRPAVDPRVERNAEVLLRSDKLIPAAREYQRLQAMAPAPASYGYGLKAAETFLRARQPRAAREVLRDLAIPSQESALLVWQAVLRAELEVFERRPVAALRHLSGLDLERVPEALQRRAHVARANIYHASGDFLAAARERNALELLLDDPKLRSENRRAIWAALNRSASAELQAGLASGDEYLRGWIHLALLAKSDFASDDAWRARLDDWAQRHPGHPATFEVLALLRSGAPLARGEPRRVALLLPLNGSFSAAALAIRDGFLGAWYAGQERGAERSVSVFDTDAVDVRTVYGEAVNQGAEMVVGPLDKPAIEALLRAGSLRVPTLALNQVNVAATRAGGQSAGENPRLYQFGLSPEDEAGQVAERAWLDGRVQALVVTPATPWGDRVARAFRRHWEALGGRIAAQHRYDTRGGDFQSALRQSVQQAWRPQPIPASTPGAGLPAPAPVNSAAGRFVFLAAFPAEARQVYPLLAQAGPVYATSHAYAGAQNAAEDRVLDGLRFADMSWNLRPETVGMRGNLVQSYPDRVKAYGRFFAFGIDAREVARNLAYLAGDPTARIDGATGWLRMDAGRQIRRQLAWARFENGVPRVLDP
ncbi:MAG: penicillin-binding protein activator [Gammaproteobacteria bacterium]